MGGNEAIDATKGWQPAGQEEEQVRRFGSARKPKGHVIDTNVLVNLPSHGGQSDAGSSRPTKLPEEKRGIVIVSLCRMVVSSAAKTVRPTSVPVRMTGKKSKPKAVTGTEKSINRSWLGGPMPRTQRREGLPNSMERYISQRLGLAPQLVKEVLAKAKEHYSVCATLCPDPLQDIVPSSLYPPVHT